MKELQGGGGGVSLSRSLLTAAFLCRALTGISETVHVAPLRRAEHRGKRSHTLTAGQTATLGEVASRGIPRLGITCQLAVITTDQG